MFDSDNTRGQLLAVLPPESSAQTRATLAAGQLSINGGELNNDAGLIYGASSVTVNTGGAALNNVNSGTDKGIAAGNGLNLVLGHLNNQTGFIGQQGAGDLTVTAANLHNVGGRISGQDLRLSAEQDINNIGGLIDATNTLVLNAKRDVNLITTTTSSRSTGAGFDLSHTNVDQVAAVVVRGKPVQTGATNADPTKLPDGALVIVAGRDANATGAVISNQSAKGITSVQADRDINLNTVTVGEQSDFVRDANNYTKSGYTQEIGTQLSGNGHIVMSANRDVNARAANVISDNGAVIVDAKRDINITSGEATMNYSSASQNTDRGMFSKTTTTTRDSISATQAQASTFSGNTVSMNAGNNLTIIGSNVVATGDVSLMAANNLTISAATNTYTESHFSESKKRGITGKQNNLSDLTESGATQSQSRALVGSLTGNVSLVAGNALGVHGSDVFAANNATLAAQTIDITAGVDVHESHLTQSGKKGSWGLGGSKHKSQDDTLDVTRSGSSISVGGQIDLAAGQRILLEGAHLDATTVKVTSLAAEGTSPDLIITGSLGQQQYSHTENSETGHVWQKQSGHGSSSQTFEQTTINGQLDIDPKFKIHVQTATPNGAANVETLSATLQALATSDPGLGYLQDLAQNPNVDWQAVTLAQDQWDYSQSGLTPVGAAILVIAVTVLTAGAGSAAAATTSTTTATTTAAGAAGTATTASVVGIELSTAVTVGGVTTVTYTAAGAALNAGMSALLASASVSLVNNHGNIADTLKELGSKDSLKNILISMTTAGVVSQMNSAFFGEGSAFLTGQTGDNANAIINKQVANQFANNVIKNMATNLVSTGINSTINGNGLNRDSLANALTNAFITAGLAPGANGIGGGLADGTLNAFTHQLAHAMLGCAGGTLTAGSSDGCAPGAVGAVVGELAAKYATETLGWDKEKALNFAKVISAASGLIVVQDGQNSGAVNLANTMGDNAAENNYLTHTQIDQWVNEMEACQKTKSDCSSIIKKYQALDIKQQEELISVCATNTKACQAIYGQLLDDKKLFLQAIDNAMQKNLPLSMKSDLGVLLYNQTEAEGVVGSTNFAQKIREKYKLSPEVAEGIAWGVLAGITGVTSSKGKPPVASAAVDKNALKYEGAPYHGTKNTPVKNKAPVNGQTTLEQSIQVKDTSPRRVAVDSQSGDFVVFDQTHNNTFHGHVRSWNELHPDMKSALIKANLVKPNGKIK